MNIKSKKKQKPTYVTQNQLQRSISSLKMAFTLRETGQMTENCVIFDNIQPGVTLKMSLIYKNEAPYNFDVRHWYDSSHYFKQLALSNLMNKLAPNNRQSLYQPKSSQKFVTSDPIPGENPYIIGYFVQYIY